MIAGAWGQSIEDFEVNELEYVLVVSILIHKEVGY